VSLAKPQTVAMLPGAREAHDRLTRALVTLASRGLRTHCSQLEIHSRWLSDSQQEREVAAKLCRSCPVLRECAEVGRYERFGVFGGVDRTPRPYKINSDQDQ
jgi:hypothetical protein